MIKKNCTVCHRLFPARLIQNFFSSSEGNRWLCPICALEKRNEIHGLPPNTPFEGEQAQALYEEAIQWVK